MTIHDLWSERVAEHPQRMALVDARHRLTYEELEAASASYAERLEVQPGEAVLVLLPVSAELYVALLALFRLGAVAMFVDPTAGSKTLRACVEMARPVAMIGGWKARLLCRTLRRIPPPRTGRGATAPVVKVPPEAPALITFTSGSTGQPKGVVRTHAFLLAQHRALARAIELEPGEVDLTTLPIFVLANLASGLTSLLSGAKGFRLTRAGGAPAFFDGLDDLQGLHQIYLGGGPVFPSLLRRLHERAPNAKLRTVYGSTEAEPIAFHDWQPGEPEGEGLLAGKPVPEIEVRIVQGTIFCPTGVAGEIVVTGEHVLQHYLDGVGEQETKFAAEGVIWHRTGDAGRLDAEGNLWLLGRCAARLDESSYPLPIESAVLDFPWVRRCACVPRAGRWLLAVEPARRASEAEWQALRSAVALRGVEEVCELRIPMDRRHRSKIDYAALDRVLSR